jgi:5,10-methenyltetrahydrofolate synthetase
VDAAETFERKQLARSIARSNRKALSVDDRTAKSLVICTHIATSIEWAESKAVLTYFAAVSEVDLRELFRISSEPQAASSTHNVAATVHENPPSPHPSSDALGPKTFGAPIVEGHTMRFGTVRTGEDGNPQVAAGPYGLREPDGPPIQLELVGLVLVPLLAFDSLGNRLGSGKGFYDRFLVTNPKLANRATIMGVAFGAQEVDHLPTEPHDYQLDAVVTEGGITRFP